MTNKSVKLTQEMDQRWGQDQLLSFSDITFKNYLTARISLCQKGDEKYPIYKLHQLVDRFPKLEADDICFLPSDLKLSSHDRLW